MCASHTFDRYGRLFSVCVSLVTVTLRLFDATTLEMLASYPLPDRPSSPNPFQDFSGGGYFYLDNEGRAVVPTTTRHVFVIRPRGSRRDATLELERDYDLTGTLTSTDKIISVLPDWSGRIWFATVEGLIGTIDPSSGSIQAIALGESITNSFAVDETGGVYVVSDRALYRLDAAPDGVPVQTWREVYQNTLVQKPCQVDDGSGTTPTLLCDEYVAITDNADPMNVVVYRRGASISGDRLVCEQPVFPPGAGATDNSLIGVGSSLIVENNYGYTGPAAVQNGASTTPGVARVDINATGTGCTLVWTSNETAPTVVPKLSLRSGLVYLYTKDPDPVHQVDAWYLTALDFATGATKWKQLAGTGVFYNNNYAPLSIGPSGAIYVGTIGGLVALRDAR